MTSSLKHQEFNSPSRRSQSLCNERCQNILYKTVFEHFIEIKNIAVLLLTAKSFQNSSFGANFLVNFVVHANTIGLFVSVLSPSSCFSLQFVPSLHIKQWWGNSEKINDSISYFIGELVKSKYLRLSLRSLALDFVRNEVLSCFFGTANSNSWPQLLELTLESCALNDTVMETISKTARHVRTVSFAGSPGITGVGFEHVSKLSSITSLVLSECTDSGLQHFANLTGITSLDLADCNNITNAGIQHVSTLTGIVSLSLSRCNKITDVSLELISKFSNITFLNLSFSRKISDSGLAHLSNLSNITSLDLSHCNNVRDTGLQHLANLVGITSLNLYGCHNITNGGLEHVAKLSGITSLNLKACANITDAGLEHISKLSKMTSLNLVWCDEITAEAKIAFIQTKLPKCVIVEDNAETF